MRVTYRAVLVVLAPRHSHCGNVVAAGEELELEATGVGDQGKALLHRKGEQEEEQALLHLGWDWWLQQYRPQQSRFRSGPADFGLKGG